MNIDISVPIGDIVKSIDQLVAMLELLKADLQRCQPKKK
jgi:hypothetical protein